MLDHLLESRISHRVECVLDRLDIVGGALQTMAYVPEAFSDLAADFSVDAFAQNLEIADLKQGYGNVWYSVDQYLDGLHFEDAPMSRCLPVWAQWVQRILLRRLFHPEAFGWAAEIFWSVEPDASLGAHVDNDDVYTVQLAGTKVWRIDPVRLAWLEAQLEAGRMCREGPWEAWVPTKGHAISLCEPTCIVTRPGDFLAMPAFALHLVNAGVGDHCLSFNASICQEQNWTSHLEVG